MPVFSDLAAKPMIISPISSCSWLQPTVLSADDDVSRTVEIVLSRCENDKIVYESKYSVESPFSDPGSLIPIGKQINHGICPFCDKPLGPRKEEWFVDLPVTTFKTLPMLLAKLWVESEPSPRYTNPEGRKIPDSLSSLQGTVCNQHLYESTSIPLSVQYQWPRRANYFLFLQRLLHPKVAARVKLAFESPWSGLLISGPRPEKQSRKLRDLRHLKKVSLLPQAG